MRSILIIGAGKSASSLVRFLLKASTQEDLYLVIGDVSIDNAKSLAADHPNAKAIQLDVFDKANRQEAIQNADIVISMLPARFHMEVAKECVKFHKNMVTASYVSKEMETLDAEVKEKGLTFMNEIGLTWH